jgi:hypothetical protein
LKLTLTVTPPFFSVTSDFFNHKVTVPGFIPNYRYFQATARSMAPSIFPFHFVRYLRNCSTRRCMHRYTMLTISLTSSFTLHNMYAPLPSIFLGSFTFVIGRPRGSLPLSPQPSLPEHDFSFYSFFVSKPSWVSSIEHRTLHLILATYKHKLPHSLIAG